MPGEMETEILLENHELFEKRPGCWEFILTIDRLERPLEEIIREVREIASAPASLHASALAAALRFLASNCPADLSGAGAAETRYFFRSGSGDSRFSPGFPRRRLVSQAMMR